MVVTTIGIGPTIHSIFPTAGQPGTQVVINASDFADNLDEIFTVVDFNGVVATPTRALFGNIIVTVRCSSRCCHRRAPT
jgi:hypothetical protein